MVARSTGGLSCRRGGGGSDGSAASRIAGGGGSSRDARSCDRESRSPIRSMEATTTAESRRSAQAIVPTWISRSKPPFASSMVADRLEEVRSADGEQRPGPELPHERGDPQAADRDG